MARYGRRKVDVAGRMRAGLRRFVQDEEGALIIFSLQIFLVMLVCTGIAIDMVRVEERRSVIQNTLDRAALAAASLSQDLDPKLVVKDYLSKAGLDYLNVNPTVEEGQFGEWRRVTISVDSQMPTIFGPLMGIQQLAASGDSQATESIGNVEISMVLDISGSMGETVSGSTTRIQMLRSAALNFVSEMFDMVQPPTAPAGRLSISVVPYNQQVTLGSQLGSIFKLSSDHTQNTCADVTTLPTNSISISPTTTLQRTMYGDSFDYWGNNFSLTSYASDGIYNCPNDSSASVLAFSNSETTINAKINGLTAGGDTAIDVGARWGLALLDKETRPVLNTMISKGWASGSLTGRPFDYDDGTKEIDETAMKVLVLMTDGQNTRTYSTKPAYRTGASGFVSTRCATCFSTNSTDWNALWYYVPGLSKPYYSMYYKKWYYASSVTGTKYTVDWSAIWAKGYTLQYAIDKFLYPPLYSRSTANTKTKIYADMAEQSEFTDKDNALEALCTTAKDPKRDILIFTVAVDAPSAGVSILRDCATADSFAYDVTSAGLTDAFASIASAINSLRLTN